MSEHICLPPTHLIIIMCVFIGLTSWYIHNDKKKHHAEPNYKYNDQILSKISKSISDLPQKLLEQEQKIQEQQQLIYEQKQEQQKQYQEHKQQLQEQQIEYKQQLQQQQDQLQQQLQKLQEQQLLQSQQSQQSKQSQQLQESIQSLQLQKKIQQLQQQIQQVQQVQLIDPELEKRILLSRRDQNVLLNDFAPPERRVPAHAYPDRYVKNQINIPTRGTPDSYQMLGVVLRNNTETAYNLFGRQTFPGSNQYEYYVQGNMDGNIVKIPITIRSSREIEDGQAVNIPGTDPSKGSFKVKLYQLDAPRYNPNIF